MMPKIGPPASDEQAACPREGVWVAREATSAGGGDLPQWESFPLQDRHRLVGLLIQAARRQVQHRPTVGPGGESGERG